MTYLITYIHVYIYVCLLHKFCINQSIKQTNKGSYKSITNKRLKEIGNQIDIKYLCERKPSKAIPIYLFTNYFTLNELFQPKIFPEKVRYQPNFQSLLPAFTKWQWLLKGQSISKANYGSSVVLFKILRIVDHFWINFWKNLGHHSINCCSN